MSKLKIIAVVSIFTILVLTEVILFKESSLRQIAAEKSIDVESQAAAQYYLTTAKRDMLALMMAYPGQIQGLKKTEDHKIVVLMLSGKEIVYDDLKVKTFEDKLAQGDLQDMLEQVYPLTDISTIMDDDFDPGRIRCYAFFHEVYGNTQSEIGSNLTPVAIGSQHFSFNKNNDAAFALESAFQELSDLTKSNGVLYRFVYPVNGAYNYRFIAGTNQLSPHSFGIAIDLKKDNRDYWRWATKAQGQTRLDSYPKELVRVFENNYFIWGGKWEHFDFLHYEYRPELIIKSKYYMDPNEKIEPWYCGYPDTGFTQDYIRMIESVLE